MVQMGSKRSEESVRNGILHAVSVHKGCWLENIILAPGQMSSWEERGRGQRGEWGKRDCGGPHNNFPAATCEPQEQGDTGDDEWGESTGTQVGGRVKER